MCYLFFDVAITKEQIRVRSLHNTERLNQDLFNKCSSKLLQDVVFQPLIWDRVDPTGNALLPLIAIDISAFACVVGQICDLLESDKRLRLEASFHNLVKPEVVAKVMENGRAGRLNRLAFKKDFEIFVKDTVSWLILLRGIGILDWIIYSNIKHFVESILS